MMKEIAQNMHMYRTISPSTGRALRAMLMRMWCSLKKAWRLAAYTME